MPPNMLFLVTSLGGRMARRMRSAGLSSTTARGPLIAVCALAVLACDEPAQPAPETAGAAGSAAGSGGAPASGPAPEAGGRSGHGVGGGGGAGRPAAVGGSGGTGGVPGGAGRSAAGSGGANEAGGAAAGSGADSGAAGGGASSGIQYVTEFDTTENPISEGGRWTQQGHGSGVDWTDVRSGGGLAYATQTGAVGYDDSIALLSGFGADYRLRAVVHFTGQRSASTGTHEVELILRGSYSPHVQHLYECNLGYAGASGWYAQIMRMNGPIGDFTEVGQAVASVPDVHDGSEFTAEVIGNVINSYVDGVKVQTATDSTHATGAPGIGFFWRGTEHVNDFAFTRLSVQGL